MTPRKYEIIMQIDEGDTCHARLSRAQAEHILRTWTARRMALTVGVVIQGKDEDGAYHQPLWLRRVDVRPDEITYTALDGARVTVPVEGREEDLSVAIAILDEVEAKVATLERAMRKPWDPYAHTFQFEGTMKITITDRFTGAVLYSGDHASTKDALVAAVKSGADLTDANLRGADLTDADLTGANLTRADLRDADLTGANLTGANLTGANLTDAKISAAIPVVANLDRRIEEATRHEGALDMAAWHTCETTHCRAGWAITLAGEAGARLEEALGPSAAGAFIYYASAGYVPNFYATDEAARKDIARRAEM